MSHPCPHSSRLDPSAWVLRWLRPLPPGSVVLDFAAGGGRHAEAAARAGHFVVAVDRDEAALRGVGNGVRTLVADLEAGPWPFRPASFDLVIVSNYLYRARFDLLCGLLRPTGALLYQTFALGNERYGRPANPAFLLGAGELAHRVERAGLHVLAFEDGWSAYPRPARVQRVVALRPPLDLERWHLDP